MKPIQTICLALFLVSLPALAETQKSAQNAEPWTQSSLRDEQFGFRPQVGFLTFTDAAGGDSARLAIGVNLDMNLLKFVDIAGLDSRTLTIGPSTGLVFSHIGNNQSGFLALGDLAGSNVLFAPLNLKVGTMVLDNLRVGGHLGGNLMWRTNQAQVRLGDQTNVQSGGNLSLFPNVGADLDFAVSRNLVVTVKPDWTVTSGPDLFTGTVALSFPLGFSS